MSASGRSRQNDACSVSGCKADGREHDGKGCRMKLTTRPLTPDLWLAFEDLFGENGAVGGCWCMYWRIGRAYRPKPREENRTAFWGNVGPGPPPGPPALDGGLPVGLGPPATGGGLPS